jgi:hypothetical protein
MNCVCARFRFRRTRVEVERLRVGAGGGAPLAADFERQVHHQRAEEGALHDQPRACGGKLGEDRVKRGVVLLSHESMLVQNQIGDAVGPLGKRRHGKQRAAHRTV